jgi:hypothetical protein
MHAGHLVRSVVGALLVSAMAAPPSFAGTVSVSGDTLTYQAAPGEKNATALRYYRPTGFDEFIYQISDSPAPSAGAGCRIGNVGYDVVCPASGIARIRLLLGDGNDGAILYGGSAAGPPPPAPIELLLGAGNDTAFVRYQFSAPVLVDGGPGMDRLTSEEEDGTTLLGGDGDDQLSAYAAARVDAGAGDDYVRLSQPRPPLRCGPGRDVAISTRTGYPITPLGGLPADCEPIPRIRVMSITGRRDAGPVKVRLRCTVKCVVYALRDLGYRARGRRAACAALKAGGTATLELPHPPKLPGVQRAYFRVGGFVKYPLSGDKLVKILPPKRGKTLRFRPATLAVPLFPGSRDPGLSPKEAFKRSPNGRQNPGCFKRS